MLMTLSRLYGGLDTCKARQFLRTLEHDPFLLEGKNLSERHPDQPKRRRSWGLTASTVQDMCMCDFRPCSRRSGGRGERAKWLRLGRAKRSLRIGHFSLSVLEQDAGYARGGLLVLGMRTICQTATKDTKAPTAEVIFLDASSRVTETRSSKVSKGD